MIEVIVRNYVKEEAVEQYLELIKNLVSESRQEIGCERYEVYKDVNGKNEYVFAEVWSTKERLDNHFETTHFKDIVKKVSEMLYSDSVISVLEKVF